MALRSMSLDEFCATCESSFCFIDGVVDAAGCCACVASCEFMIGGVCACVCVCVCGVCALEAG